MSLTSKQKELLDDLVGGQEIAEHFGVDRRLVYMWAERSGANGFPAPVLVRKAGRFYRLSEVQAWHAGNERVGRGKEGQA